MSQQEMEFADLHLDEPEAAYRGYRGPSYQNYEAGATSVSKSASSSRPERALTTALTLPS